MLTRTATLIASAAAISPATAQIAFTEDARSTSSSTELTLTDAAGGEPLVLTDDASSTPSPLFAAFDASDLALLIGPEANTGTALSVQNSGAIGDLITASGFVETQVDLATAAPGSVATASAESLYRVGFTVDESSYYILRVEGEIRAESPSQGFGTNAEAGITIEKEIDGTFYHRYGPVTREGNSSDSVDERVMLTPGSYRFEFSAASQATTTAGNPGQSEASYDMAVELLGRNCNYADVAPPYFVLDLNDVTGYVEAYTTQDSLVDVEPYGIFELLEIQVFVSDFLDGCD